MRARRYVAHLANEAYGPVALITSTCRNGSKERRMGIYLARATTIAVLASMMGCGGIGAQDGTEDGNDDIGQEEVGTAEQALCVYSILPPSAFDDEGDLTYSLGYEELQGQSTGGCDRYITSIELHTTVHTLRIGTMGALSPCKPAYNIDAWARNNSTWTKLDLDTHYVGGTIWQPPCGVEATYTFSPTNGYDEIVTATRINGQTPTFDIYVERY
jgi:hypothetical protein